MADAVPAPRAPAAETGAPSLLTTSLRDAAMTALVVALLTFPLISHLTVQAPDRLLVESRWFTALSIVAVAFVGRLVIGLVRRPSAGPGQRRVALSTGGAMRWLGPALLAFAVVLPFLPIANGRVMDVAIKVLTYVMLGWGLNVVVGLAGLLDLGFVAFYAIGAYSFGILAEKFGMTFWMCLPLAGILAAMWGVILGFPVLRLRGDYLAIVTLAFGEIIRVVIENWQDLTGGPNGITTVPAPSLFGYKFVYSGPESLAERFGFEHSPTHKLVYLYFIILLLALITNVITQRLRRLPIGRAWEALREDEIACRALGINTVSTKLTAFAIGAMFGGFAGTFFAAHQGAIAPASFRFDESAAVLAIVVLGGMGSQYGVVLASLILVAGVEFLREFEGLIKSVVGDWFNTSQLRLIAFGLAMVGIMLVRPRGLVSTREPSVALKERRAISGDLVKEGHG